MWPRRRFHKEEESHFYNLECLYSNSRSELEPEECSYICIVTPPRPPAPARMRGKDTLANPIVELGSLIKVKERWISSRPPYEMRIYPAGLSEAPDAYAGILEAIIPRDGSTHRLLYIAP